MVVEDTALGGQPALALRLGYPDVAEDRRIDGSTSGSVDNQTSCLFASLFGGVYPYLGRVDKQLLEKRVRWRKQGSGV